MRVIHVITRLIVGGAQENTLSTVLGLRDTTEFDLRLVSGPTSGPEGSLESLLPPPNGFFTIIPSLVRPLHPPKDFAATRALTALFRQLQPTLVHTHSGKAGILGRWAAHFARVPLIVHSIHGPSFGPFQHRAANLLFRSAERCAARCTTHFVSVAQAMSDQYVAAGIGHPSQFTRIPSGFDLQPFLDARNDLRFRQSLGLHPSDVVLGMIARLTPLKGHDDLFDAATELVRHLPRLKFLLVGDGIWRGRFEQRASDLRLRDRFIFAGLVPPAQIPSLVGVMDFLVHLSRREGLPRALPQALAAARPVVACDCDGAREICLPSTGFLIPPGDRRALVSAVITLASNPSLRQRLGSHGQALVRAEFSVEKMVRDMAALYRGLAGTHLGK